MPTYFRIRVGPECVHVLKQMLKEHKCVVFSVVCSKLYIHMYMCGLYVKSYSVSVHVVLCLLCTT